MAALLVRANGFVYSGHFVLFDCVLTVFDDWYTVGALLVQSW